MCLTDATESNPVPIFAQVLVNPALNLTKESSSYSAYSYFIKRYLDDANNAEDPRISPLLGKDFSNLPPAIIVVGENDRIRDEGEEYNSKLLKSGIHSSLYVQPKTGHLAHHYCAAGETAKPAIDFVIGKLAEMDLK